VLKYLVIFHHQPKPDLYEGKQKHLLTFMSFQIHICLFFFLLNTKTDILKNLVFIFLIYAPN